MEAHPFSVHFPVALLLVAGVSYGVSLFRDTAFFRRAGLYLHLLGVSGLVLAILTGRAAQAAARSQHPPEDLIRQHELSGYVVLWLAAMLLVWVWLRPKATRREFMAITLILAAVLGLLIWDASLGGTLVYRYGIGVDAPPALPVP
ncbi:MAG: DUF2231 domain-containing protein [Bacteroidia bacterium]|nr:DUF2231 domain-containing protein [Bacteroidia bacterium]